MPQLNVKYIMYVRLCYGYGWKTFLFEYLIHKKCETLKNNYHDFTRLPGEIYIKNRYIVHPNTAQYKSYPYCIVRGHCRQPGNVALHTSYITNYSAVVYQG